ncbi:MAG TPA: serine/threonine-protein kinase [Acidobacteriaceae bacterium]|nr:serine/threonine-protein kinase [Acidobacteriaceae bacterium]
MILDLIGRGGMGQVYAAYDPKLDRRVAVKLLRPHYLDTAVDDEAQSRLLREAQAIACLSHPNVVAVYDAGTWEGHVFIAMEYVEGKTLGDWGRRQVRGWKEVLEVFAGAARGLAAAHAAGLIHRDFKPENVMVSREGVARVMDFGLVRRQSNGDTGDLEQMAPQSIALTRTGALMGTPRYMAPEQLLGKPAEPRSDQFSFSVALFEALYDHRPFSGDDLPTLRDAVLNGRLNLPAGRRKVPAWLRSVVLRGLSVAPERRFASMPALLAALDRGSGRRRSRVLIAAAVALVAVAFSIYRIAGRQGQLCRGGTARLAAAWDTEQAGGRAPRRAAVKQAFLSTGLRDAPAIWERTAGALDRYRREWADAYTETCEATQVRGEQSSQVLDLRMSCLNERLEELKALTSLFAAADAAMVARSTATVEALGALDRCANVPVLLAVVPPPQAKETRAAVDRLRQSLAQVKALLDVGHYGAGVAMAIPLSAEARRLGYRPLLAEVLMLLGRLQYEAGDSATSQSTLAQALAEAEASRHDEVLADAATLLAGAIVETDFSRAAEAERWLTLAAAALDRMGPGHERTRGWILTERAAIASRLHDFSSAVSFSREAVRLKEKVLGSDSPDVGNSLMNLDLGLVGLGEPAEALFVNDRELRIYRQAFGDDSSYVAACLSNRGEALYALGRYEDARVAFERAISTWTTVFGPEHRYLGYALTGLGRTRLATKDPHGAVAALTRALAIRLPHEPNAWLVSDTRFALAQALWASGASARARAEAAAARAGLPTLPQAAPDRDEIGRWLAARSGSLSVRR